MNAIRNARMNQSNDRVRSESEKSKALPPSLMLLASRRSAGDERERLCADPNLIARLQIGDVDSLAIHAGAVRAVEVIHAYMTSSSLEPRVAAGDIRCIEHHRIVRRSAD